MSREIKYTKDVSRFVILGNYLMYAGILAMLWAVYSAQDSISNAHILAESMNILAYTVVCIIAFSYRKGMIFGEKLPRYYFFFYILLVLDCLGLLSDFFAWYFRGRADRIVTLWFANTVFYLVGPLSIYCFWLYVKSLLYMVENKVIKIIHMAQTALIITAETVIIVNLFAKIYFDIDSNGYYHRTNGSYILNVVPNVLMITCSLVILLRSKESLKNDKIKER